MTTAFPINRKILLIDDNLEIHSVFKQVIEKLRKDADPVSLETSLFNEISSAEASSYFLASAYQGEEGYQLAVEAARSGTPFAVAFVDVVMPPGINGVETVKKIWKDVPDLEVVVCTGYDEYSHHEMLQELGETHQLLLLKKPFDLIEIRQMISALTLKWSVTRIAEQTATDLEELVEKRTKELTKTTEMLAKESTDRRRTAELLWGKEAEYQGIFNAANDAFIISDFTGKIVDANPQACKMYGYYHDEIIKLRVKDLVHPSYHNFFENFTTDTHLQLEKFPTESVDVRKDGTFFNVEIKINKFEYKGKNHFLSIIRDVTERKLIEKRLQKAYLEMEQRVEERTTELTDAYQQLILEVEERKQAEEALKESEKKFRTLFEEAREPVYITTRDGTFIDVNKATLDLIGYTREEMIKLKAQDFYIESEVREKFQEAIEKNGFVKDFTVKLRRKDKRIIECLITATAWRAPDGRIQGYQGIMRDITDQKHWEEKLAYLATHDPLTNLPNRRLFHDHLIVALAHSERKEQKLAVLLFDLDQFKQINDSFGHEVGDQLLKEVSRRIKKIGRKGDTIARLGGDEFLILLPEILQGKDAELVAEKFRKALEEPFSLGNINIKITISIGIAIYPDDGDNGEELIRCADIAMYQAKDMGRNICRRYQNEIPFQKKLL